MSFGKSCWWVLFGLRPLFCVWFAVFRTDETQIWLGDLRVVFSFLFVFFVLVRCDLPALLGLLGPCTNSFLTAYTGKWRPPVFKVFCAICFFVALKTFQEHQKQSLTQKKTKRNSKEWHDFMPRKNCKQNTCTHNLMTLHVYSYILFSDFLR